MKDRFLGLEYDATDAKSHVQHMSRVLTREEGGTENKDRAAGYFYLDAIHNEHYFFVLLFCASLVAWYFFLLI